VYSKIKVSKIKACSWHVCGSEDIKNIGCYTLKLLSYAYVFHHDQICKMQANIKYPSAFGSHRSNPESVIA
jgi:hypothetical protein